MKKFLVLFVASPVLGAVAGFLISSVSLLIGERIESLAGLHFGVPWPEVTMLGYIGVYAPILGAVAGSVGAIDGKPLTGAAIGAITSALPDLMLPLQQSVHPLGSFPFFIVVALLVGAGAGALGGYIRKKTSYS
jgi:hypothetical protein